ncbi:MAG: glycosyltransferase family 29 protein [Planctomycetota bacterium]
MLVQGRCILVAALPLTSPSCEQYHPQPPFSRACPSPQNAMPPQSLVRAFYRQFLPDSIEVRSWRELAQLPLFNGASVALVGNAGYLIDSPNGRFIDQHDVVIRMNNFRTLGYEKSVGRRTDVFLTNFWIDIDYSRPELAEVPIVVSSSPNNFRTRRRQGVTVRHAPLVNTGMAKMGRRVVFAPTLPWFVERIGSIGRYPTTGAVGAMLLTEYLLNFCHDAYVTGFSFFTGRNHYFSKRFRDTANHNVDRERRFLSDCLRPHLESGRIRVDDRLRRLLQQQAA